MDDGIFRSITAMQLESKRQEAIARNLAGASIPGFKRDFIVSESFKSEMAEAGENMTGDLEGTSLGKTYVDKGLINYLKDKQEIILATLDEGLQKKVRNPIMIIRQKKKLEIVNR